MKCCKCNDTKIIFSVIPDGIPGIAWASHVLSDRDGYTKLYHYQCGDVDMVEVYKLFIEMDRELNG